MENRMKRQLEETDKTEETEKKLLVSESKIQQIFACVDDHQFQQAIDLIPEDARHLPLWCEDPPNFSCSVWPLLGYAATQGACPVIKYLLDGKADIEQLAPNRHTPLLLAVRAGHVKTIELLLDRGANIEARTHKGRTPLMIAAASHARQSILELLIERGADIEAHDNVRSILFFFKNY